MILELIEEEGRGPFDYDILAAQITRATGLHVRSTLDECDELDKLLREGLLHISHLLSLIEGPRELTEHEFFAGATEFWLALRIGMCTAVITEEDGVKRLCPNNLVDGFHFCESCLTL